MKPNAISTGLSTDFELTALGTGHRPHPNSSRRFRMRNTRAAPRLTASSRMTPSNSGCQSGGRSKTNRRSRDRAQDEGAEDRADGAAGAAEQRGAADHHGGDRVQRVGAADRGARLAGIGDEGQQQAGDRARGSRPACRPRAWSGRSARPTCRPRPRPSRWRSSRGRSPSGGTASRSAPRRTSEQHAARSARRSNTSPVMKSAEVLVDVAAGSAG